MAGQLQTTWPQVLAWRMRRHLLDPVTEVDVVDVVRRLCGVQAQVPAAADFAVRVRQLSAPRGGVSRALEERRVMRTLRSGWGAVLKPVSWQGGLCHAVSDGNRVSFARPDQWLPDWAGLPDPEEAAQVVIPAYLRAYGPATPERFDAWLTRGVSRKAALRSWFATLQDRMATVEVDGEAALLLAEDVDDLGGTSPTQTVRLLPGFDQYVLGPGTKAEEIIAPSRRAQVSRAAGWISPVVVAGGLVAGTWEVDGRKVQVRLFEDAGPIPAPALEAEVARVEELL